MPARKAISAKSALGFKSANKDRRKSFHIKQKKARDALKRDERFARKKEEDKNPRLREARLRDNVPQTVDSKRQWDEALGEDGDDMLGLAVDLEKLNKRRRVEEQEKLQEEAENSRGEEDSRKKDTEDTEADGFVQEGEDSDADSMLDSADEEDDNSFKKPKLLSKLKQKQRAPSPNPSTTSTRLDLTPESLAAKFPTLFAETSNDPKILITTSINSTLHEQADLLTQLFPNSAYVRRSAHRFGHKFSVKEISAFAANRNFTTVMILNEGLHKKPSGLDIVHLPEGPMFHFTLSNWIEGKRLPGHGNASDHYPELILNNFKTPLGLLTAHLFRTMFPPRPDFEGRQVVTMHNQRDFLLFRRHRYVFRDKRATEKAVLGTDGQPMKGVEDLKVGLQELGPRFTLKLRRVDRGIQRSSGQEWEWKGKTDRVRTKFQL